MIFIILLLLTAGLLIEAKEKEKEFNLNFQQTDYRLKYGRTELARYNKNYVKDFSVVTYKYNRTAAVTNATFTLKVDLGNAVVIITQAYKFMSNEYRFFPIHVGANLCKALAANVAGSRNFFKCGNFTGCPFLKGRKQHVCNFHPDEYKLPPFIPDGEYKLEFQLLHGSIEICVANTYFTIFRPIVIKD